MCCHGVHKNCRKGFHLPFFYEPVIFVIYFEPSADKNSSQLLLYLDLLPGRLSCQINSELPVNLGVAFHIQNLCQIPVTERRIFSFANCKRVASLSFKAQVLVKDFYTRFTKCSKKCVS